MIAILIGVALKNRESVAGCWCWVLKELDVFGSTSADALIVGVGTGGVQEG